MVGRVTLPAIHVVRSTFKNIEDKSPSYFIRIHKSSIVNAHHISALKTTIVIGRGRELPIGEAYRQPLIKFVQERG